MHEDLLLVRQRLVNLMRADPPFKLAPAGPGGLLLDRWMATRLTQQELSVLGRLEELYGEFALAELFAEVLYEAGVLRRGDKAA